ncbi:hypothetical protein SCALIN_C05_0038 [Candidatus Scalindua japonica]|uniref:VWFA domain-containing protein n=2 Tax=Candidatus Scalindua japonica TaxID=1284222 RepID=A0A286TVP8_9BACT|nr:hypothetical protein SCALIN_C05_0038 [Candidatus Scalindua japonica]
MNDEEIKKIMQQLDIPGPDESKKKVTVNAAMTEFNRQKQIIQKNFKGIEGERRLTGKLKTVLTFFGEFAMKKSFVITGAVTACIALLIIGLSYFSVYKSDFQTKVVQYEPEKTPIQPSDTLEQNNKRSQKDTVTNNLQKIGSVDSNQSVLTKTEKQDGKMRFEDEGIFASVMVNEEKVDMASPSVTTQPKPKERSRNIVSEKKKTTAGLRQGNITPRREALALEEMDCIATIPPPGEHGINEYRETGRDRFETIKPNPVKMVTEEPVSTFSVDVDTASYAFIRRQLNHGALPQKNAVRVEEMINYFDYDYSVPTDRSRPFQPTIVVYPTPWNSETKLLHIGIKGYDIVPEQKPVSNLVFLLDVSGSMNSHDKLPLLKHSFRMLINTLNEEDTIAIVVYAGAAGTVLEPTKVKEKSKILAALDKLQAGGSTAGGEGVRKAYELAEANFNKEGVNRVILATDGDFNVGIQNPEELKNFIERKRAKGIFLSVLGFGQGNYNDALMQKLAQNGNGNAAYIDNLNEARKVLVDESSSTIFTIAKDVKLQIEFNPNLIAEYRLIGYETRILKREDFNNDKVDAGDIGSGHSVTALYEITPVNSKQKLIDDLRYKDSNHSGKTEKKSFNNNEYGFLKIRYKLPDSDKSDLTTTSINKDNEYTRIDDVSADVRFAASVAAFGQLLRGGTYTGEFTYKDVINLAKTAIEKDTFGYRHEFLNLIRLAENY